MSREYTLDRYNHAAGSAFTFDTTTTQDSSTPDGFSKSLKITPDSTQTPTGSHNGTIRQVFEGQDFQDLAFGTSSAKSVTVSFYAKSSSQNNNHQYGVQLRCRSGSTTQYVSQAFNVTSSWQRFTMTFVGNTGVAIRNDTEVGFEICFHLASGPDDIVSAKSTWTTSGAFQTVTGQSNFMDNTSNEFYLTGVQLEVGDTPTSFEHRSFGEELLRCQRYYQQFIGLSDQVALGFGRSNGTTVAEFNVPLSVPLAKSPTLNACSWAVFTATNQSNSASQTPAVRRWRSTNNMLACALAGMSGMTNARTLTVYLNSSHTFSMDAEI